MFGINAVVIATFVMIALSFDQRDSSGHYPRKNLLEIEPFRAVVMNRAFLSALKLISVGLFALTILAGFFGSGDADSNFAPTFFWISFWVGMGFLAALAGNIWPLVNPWKILFEWAGGLIRRAGPEGGTSLGLRYPPGLGVWPAVVLFIAFVWFEIVSGGSSVPANIALFLVFYSLVTWLGMAAFGKEAWLRNGEAFSVFFDTVSRFAPTEVRVGNRKVCENCAVCRGGDCVNCHECFRRAAPEEREINLRPPVVGLGVAGPASPSRMAFVVAMLAGVTFDSLLATQAWQRIPVPDTLALAGLLMVFLALYLGSIKLSEVSGGGAVSFRRLASNYIYSLVPIAIAYLVAHYYSYLLIQGQGMVALASDPFGWGWNLFGTAGFEVRSGIVDAGFVWYSQVALILAGHIAAVYLAHKVALRLFEEPMKAARSQYPMLGMMVFYTVFSLWILTQPIA